MKLLFRWINKLLCGWNVGLYFRPRIRYEGKKCLPAFTRGPAILITNHKNQMDFLLVLYLFLKHFLMKPLMEIMEKRQAQVETDLNDAASEKQEAIRLKEQYEGSLREAEDQAGRILEDAKKMGRTEYEKILRQADDDAAKKLEQADRMIGLEREKTLRELQGLTKELAATATEKLLKENSGQEADRKRFAAFLADTGEKYD